MEKNFVLNGNKLIAKFMNFKIDIENKNGLFTLNSTMDKIESEVSYHKSWDWLMPVVEKIISIPLLDNINECNYIYIGFDYEDNSHYVNLYNGEDSQINGNSKNSKIEAIYNAVVKFIKWYNEHGKDEK